MTPGPDPWKLPGPGRWLDTVAGLLSHGAVVLPVDPGRPSGVVRALRDHLRMNPFDTRAGAGQSPAATLSDAFGTAPTLEGLLNPALDQDLAIVTLAGLGQGDMAGWSVFLERFAAARAAGRGGPALLFVDPPAGLTAPPQTLAESWRATLRRGDLVIWAEEHLPATRDGLAAELAVALAVDLCGWRLDLAAALVQAALRDLAAPLDWLASRGEAPTAGADPPCPLALLAAGGRADLQRRVWKAQLVALFPALEEWRLEIVGRHRDRLAIDDHLRSLGVTSVEEIELGALGFQLQRSLSRAEADRLRLLARARNRLAHRRPVEPDDALPLLAG